MLFPIKKVFKASLIALTVLLSVNSYAGVYSVPNIPYFNTGEVTLYANEKFLGFLLGSNSLNYAETKTGYKLSCGPTALLFAHNYHTFVTKGKYDDLSYSVSGVKGVLDRQYAAMGLKVNSTTHFEQLYKLAQNNLGMSLALYNYTAPADMAQALAENRIFVVNVKDGSPMNNLKMDHFVTLIASYTHKGQQYMIYFDPWDGIIKKVSYQDFVKSIGASPTLRIPLM